MLDMLSDRGSAFVCRDIALECDRARDGLDRGEVDAYDQTLRRHGFSGDLAPRTRCGAEIDEDMRFLEEPIFLIKLDQFERRTGSVALLFGKFVPLV